MYVGVVDVIVIYMQYVYVHDNYVCPTSLSTVVLNSRDRQGMYGMQHFRAPINKPHNSL